MNPFMVFKFFEKVYNFQFFHVTPDMRYFIFSTGEPVEYVLDAHSLDFLFDIKNEKKFATPCGYFPRFYGYISYECGSMFDVFPSPKGKVLEFPQIYFGLYRDICIYDRLNEKFYFYPPKNFEPLAPKGYELSYCGENFLNQEFFKAFKIIKENIHSGNIYQANLSKKFLFNFRGDAFGLFLSIFGRNPSPYSFYLKLEDKKIVSVSPELLLEINGIKATTKPIAGTRPRGRTPLEDIKFINQLKKSIKENSEHTMLVDLERNDLGKFCKNVRVENFMMIEKYSHVIHLVSKIAGSVIEKSPVLIGYMFPGGTITGCPKIESIKILNYLEPDARGPYTGSFGWIDPYFNMVFNIIIRSIFIDGSKAYAGSGAGIVYDSVFKKEVYEINKKAQIFLDESLLQREVL